MGYSIKEDFQTYRSQLNAVDSLAVELAEDLENEYFEDDTINELIEALQKVTNLITDVQSAQKWI